ncbi:MAG: thiamine pyrophosphate-binding protein [Dehalococcoidia bacterium]|nr:thiamine pyrophosphate-binding protein [Dehalococcoidia bacterium]
MTTHGGKGAIADSHPLALGCARAGRVYGPNPLHEYLPMCDVALVLGRRLAYNQTVGVGLGLPPRLIHVDIDPGVFGKNYPPTIAVQGDVKTVLRQRLEALRGKALSKGDARLREIAEAKAKARAALHAAGPNQQRTMDALRAAIPSEAIVVADAAMPAYWAAQGFPVEQPRTYISPYGWGSIGFGWPASLGARLGKPERKVALISGNGGFQLNLQELGTAVQERIPVVATVWNDGAWGMLKGMQRDRYQGWYIETELVNPDFMKLAEA